ncbi:MAG: MFS transporter [Pseudomonadota bacterium]
MNVVAKAALILVIFIDIMGQGLVFPIVDTLVMDPQKGILPAGTPQYARQFSYGLVIGTFFLSWFLGAPYVSKLSDVIGRKRAIMVCLVGAFSGYALTVVAIELGSFWLLIVGRAITGFTAANQPIAQAALIDSSANEAERARNMGLSMLGVSLGLLAGPAIGGVASDPNLIGSVASIVLPFYIALGIVGGTGLLVVVFFHDVRTERLPFRFRVLEVFESLYRLRRYPLVMRITAVLFFFHLANATFYIFIGSYMATEFGYRTLGNSLIMLTIGCAIASSSTFLVVPAQKWLTKRAILQATFIVWLVCLVAVVLLKVPSLVFVPVFGFYFIFGIAYPTFLAIYSLTVGDDEQGWVMGVAIAVFTLTGGTMSLVGGSLMALYVDMPFYVSIFGAAAGLAAMALLWRDPAVRRITGKG